MIHGAYRRNMLPGALRSVAILRVVRRVFLSTRPSLKIPRRSASSLGYSDAVQLSPKLRRHSHNQPVNDDEVEVHSLTIPSTRLRGREFLGVPSSDSYHRLTRALMMRLESSEIEAVAKLFESFVDSNSRTLFVFHGDKIMKRFGSKVQHDPLLLAHFERFMRGSMTNLADTVAQERVDDCHTSAVDTRIRIGRSGSDYASPDDGDGAVGDTSAFKGRTNSISIRETEGIASILLRIRESSPRTLGAYVAAPEHIKLSRVFEALVEVQELTSAFDDNFGATTGSRSAFSGTASDAAAARARRRLRLMETVASSNRAEALSVGDVDFDEAGRGAMNLAERLVEEVPPRAVKRLKDALLVALAGQEKTELGTDGATDPIDTARHNSLAALPRALGHHWSSLGPTLCRFMKVYDDSAAAVCPFAASWEAWEGSMEVRLFGPLNLVRSRCVTAAVKLAADPIPSKRNKLNAQLPSVPSSPSDTIDAVGATVTSETYDKTDVPPASLTTMLGVIYERTQVDDQISEEEAGLAREVLQAGAAVTVPELTEKSPYNVPVFRLLRLRMRAVAEEQALLAMATDSLQLKAAAAAAAAATSDSNHDIRSMAEEACQADSQLEMGDDDENSRRSAPAPSIAVAGGYNSACTVFVRNLPPCITTDELADFFRFSGGVVGVQLYNNEQEAPHPVEETLVLITNEDSGSVVTLGGGDEGLLARSSMATALEVQAISLSPGGTGENELGGRQPQLENTLMPKVEEATKVEVEVGEEWTGLSMKERDKRRSAKVKEDNKERKAAIKKAKREAREQQEREAKLEKEALKAERAEAKAAKEVARVEAKARRAKAKAEKEARDKARKTVGRKLGVKSVIAAKNVSKRRDSDVYAFVEFESREAALRAAGQAARIFGVNIKGRTCHTLLASESRTLYLHAPDQTDGPVVSELELWLNRNFAPHVHVLTTTGGKSSLLQEVTPNVVKIDFPSHDAAAWSFRALKGKVMERSWPLPSVNFSLHWMNVGDAAVRKSFAVALDEKNNESHGGNNGEVDGATQGTFDLVTGLRENEVEIDIGPESTRGELSRSQLALLK